MIRILLLTVILMVGLVPGAVASDDASNIIPGSVVGPTGTGDPSTVAVCSPLDTTAGTACVTGEWRNDGYVCYYKWGMWTCEVWWHVKLEAIGVLPCAWAETSMGSTEPACGAAMAFKAQTFTQIVYPTQNYWQAFTETASFCVNSGYLTETSCESTTASVYLPPPAPTNANLAIVVQPASDILALVADAVIQEHSIGFEI